MVSLVVASRSSHRPASCSAIVFMHTIWPQARCKKIGTSEAMASRSLRSGILLVSVQLIWLKLQPMTQRLVPRTFSAPSLHIRTTSS